MARSTLKLPPGKPPAPTPRPLTSRARRALNEGRRQTAVAPAAGVAPDAPASPPAVTAAPVAAPARDERAKAAKPSAAGSKTGTGRARKPEATRGAKPWVRRDADPDAKPGAKPWAKRDADPNAKPGAKPWAKRDADPNAKPGAKPWAKRDADPNAKPGAKPWAKRDADPNAKPGAKPWAKRDADPNAKPGAKPWAKSDARRGGKPGATAAPKPWAKRSGGGSAATGADAGASSRRRRDSASAPPVGRSGEAARGPRDDARGDAATRRRTTTAPAAQSAWRAESPAATADDGTRPPPRRASATTLTPDLPRLSKRMGELGLCSRREADEWIENGWVSVDGVVITTLGTRIAPDAKIDVDPAARRQQRELVTILLNKPVGYVSGQPEDGYLPAVVLVKPENHWSGDRAQRKFVPGHLRGLAPAGRLDIDSTGLLVFTQDGRVAKRLIGENSEVEKEYLVRVEGALAPADMKRLQHGLELDGVPLKPARVSWQNESQLRIVLREGKKRQIRRMCELVGLTVTGLKRVRSGSVSLGPLPEGQWRYLGADERF
jgi:23S rRNA pseudouridine2604 synthase